MPSDSLSLPDRIQQAREKPKRGEPLTADDFLLLFAHQIMISYSHQERGYGIQKQVQKDGN
jgi:hypothetical protein